MKLRKIDPLSFGVVNAILGVLLGLILAIIYIIVGATLTSSLGLGAAFGGIMFITLPLTYAIFGFVGGIIGAALYNLVARWTGGIKITLQQ